MYKLFPFVVVSTDMGGPLMMVDILPELLVSSLKKTTTTSVLSYMEQNSTKL